MVTINAAKAFNVQYETGSIEPGKRADLTVVDFNKPHLTPSFDIAAELPRYTYGSDGDRHHRREDRHGRQDRQDIGRAGDPVEG
ncbi:hypothetical protein E3J39_02870 [Candidatus Bathyarchaeota archaeon]|nr:MAG: hypothetical protein E3J39_02870 [Candidatus Bathyarchaeota archaeon]